MAQMKAARELWRTNEMPRKRGIIRFKRHFSQAEFERLGFGEMPQQMEDKWFIFLENFWLFFHRSWTGDCIFQLRLEAGEDGYDVTEAWVNREIQQYNSGGRASELELLSSLVMGLLLRNS